MAQTTKHLRDLLEKIKSDAQRALSTSLKRNRIAISRLEMHCLPLHKAFHEACSIGNGWQVPSMQEHRVSTYFVTAEFYRLLPCAG